MDTSEVRTVHFDGICVNITLDRYYGETAICCLVSGDVEGSALVPVVATARGSAILPAPPPPPPSTPAPLTVPPLSAEYVAARTHLLACISCFHQLLATLSPELRVLAADAYEAGVADQDAVECLRRSIRFERREWSQAQGYAGPELRDFCAVILRDASGSLPFVLANRTELARFVSASPCGTVIGRVITHERNLAPYLFGAGFLTIPPTRYLDPAGNLLPYGAPLSSVTHGGTL
jgi:hypothetical protein